ncbi:hypothetical protein ACA910_019209 [Epithemia clementina (nom. ined.)]
MANQYAGSSWDPPIHLLEHQASTPPQFLLQRAKPLITVPPPAAPYQLYQATGRPTHPRRIHNHLRPLAYADVFIDDEILVGQGSAARLNRFPRQVLHLNDKVFRPNNATNNSSRKQPISTRKLDKGDACWATRKQVLGWEIDTLAGTMELPPHRQERLLTILCAVAHKKRISVKQTHKLLGELRSMVLGIPGGQGLFSQLQLALTQSDKHRVCLDQGAQDAIKDFLTFALNLTQQPTSLSELFPTKPTFVDACDAAKTGMGGVWLPDSAHDPPVVWRKPFPLDIQRQLVSFNNPNGTISNSDLELAGTIAQVAVLPPHHQLAAQTLAICSNNTPAVSWQGCGAVTTAGPAAYIPRLSALHQRQHRCLVQHLYIPGPANLLADIASRQFHLTNHMLLTYLNSIAPHPQPWKMLQLPPGMRLQLISALQQHRPAELLLPVVPPPPIASGPTTGYLTPNCWDLKTPSSATLMTQFCYSASSPIASVTVAPVAAVTWSALNAYVTKYWPSQKRSLNWASQIPASRLMAPWIPDSPASIAPLPTPTRPRIA